MQLKNMHINIYFSFETILNVTLYHYSAGSKVNPLSVVAHFHTLSFLRAFAFGIFSVPTIPFLSLIVYFKITLKCSFKNNAIWLSSLYKPYPPTPRSTPLPSFPMSFHSRITLSLTQIAKFGVIFDFSFSLNPAYSFT